MKKDQKSPEFQNQDNVLNRISQLYPSFSKGQKRLADYILKHYDSAVFLTAAKLGQEARVSESTTVRFAVSLGFEGYPEFHRALEQVVMNKLDTVQRMQYTYGHVPESEILDTVMQSDVEKIRQTLEEIDHDAFEKAVDRIIQARHIYIVGLRSCAHIASFLSYYMHMIFDNVHLVTANGTSEILEQMIRVNEEDVVIGISFPRYSLRTLTSLEFAHNRKAFVVAITDSIQSPVVNFSDCNLIAKSDMASIVDSLVAPLSLVNSLIVALCMKKHAEVLATFEMMEQVYDEYQVYQKSSQRGQDHI